MSAVLDIKEETGIIENAQGKVEFTIDEDGVSIFQFFVLKRRCGIGSALIESLEDFCLQRNIQKITVPSTPSKEALSFWLARGYHYVFPEDSKMEHTILDRQDAQEITETDSGVILLEKTVEDYHEKPRRIHKTT